MQKFRHFQALVKNFETDFFEIFKIENGAMFGSNSFVNVIINSEFVTRHSRFVCSHKREQKKTRIVNFGAVQSTLKNENDTP